METLFSESLITKKLLIYARCNWTEKLQRSDVPLPERENESLGIIGAQLSTPLEPSQPYIVLRE